MNVHVLRISLNDTTTYLFQIAHIKPSKELNDVASFRIFLLQLLTMSLSKRLVSWHQHVNALHVPNNNSKVDCQ